MSDHYKTVDHPSKGLFKSKGSKFIAYLFSCKTEESFKDQLAFIKTMEPQARHHCWAYRLNPEDLVERYNDDGEPSNTAGAPIFRALLQADLVNVGCVVVRYFGGTKLGVSGLIEAYHASAFDACENSAIEEKEITRNFEIFFNYDQLSFVERTARMHSAEIVNRIQESTLSYTIQTLRSTLEETISSFESNHLIRVKRT